MLVPQTMQNRPCVIRVENLSKKYVIGRSRAGGETFREAFSSALAAPFLRLAGRQGANSGQEQFWSLKDINFEIRQGEVVGLVGRNGAGKSTLLKILSRITEPTSGRAEIRGRVASLLEVGTGFHGELTGRENIYLNGAIIGMNRTEIRSKFDQIVAFAEVDKFIDTPLKRYSTGMYLRLAFAVASHLNSDILLIDEVLAVGDAGFQEKCFNSMETATKNGRTIILVSHNLHIVKRLCQRAILLKGGRLFAEGEVNGVVEAYQNEVRSTKDDRAVERSRGIIFERSTEDEAAEVSIERIQLFDSEFNVLQSLATWDSFILRIFYKCEHEIRLAAAELHITTLDGVCLMKCSSYCDRNDKISLKAGDGHIDFFLNKLELASGRYELGIGLALAGLRWLCFVRVPLEIGERDIYNSGFPPTATQKYVAPQFQWVCNGLPLAE
jgi:lipopolysaccharide transport system ATP-binding protein